MNGSHGNGARCASVDGSAAGRGVAIAGGACSWSAARASHRATSPAIAEHAAPTRSAPLRPKTSISTRPATHGPGHGPERVRHVQATECLAHLVRSREMAHERGERRSHHDRGGGEREDCQHEARQRQIGRALKGWVNAAVCLVDQAERERRNEHDEDQGDLEQPVEAQWRPDPIGDPATDAPHRWPCHRRSRSGSPTQPASYSRRRGRAGVTTRSRRRGPPRRTARRWRGPGIDAYSRGL